MNDLSPSYPQDVRRLAEQYFRIDLLNCAESVLKALLVCAGLPCPASLLKTASGFGRGMGGAGCACGALTGGVMAIGIFFGRENDTGMPPDICAELSKKWHDTFKSMNKATCCRVLHHGLAYGTPEQFDSCCHRTAEAAEAAAKLILEASNRHS